MVARLVALLLAVALASPVCADGMRGYLAIQGDRVLATEGAEQLFTPASVQKIVVAAAVLHYLGHDHQLETVVRARGPIQDGALRGDLVLEAAGDPTWSATFFPDDAEAPFRALADQVRAAGIARVDGDLIVDLSRFPGRRAPTSRSQTEMGLAFGAPVSGLAVDENTADIRIAPGRKVGDRASVAGGRGLELRNDTVTVPAARHGRGTVEFLPQWGDGSIRVRGEYPLTEPPYTIRVSLPAPERTVGERLRDHLVRLGIEVRGAVRVEADAAGRLRAGDSAPVVARLFSPPLSEIVVPVLRDSSNWTAEMLVLQVALARTGAGRYDDGIEALGTFLTEEVGIAGRLFSIDDVSGLSPENLLSPQAVVSLLRFVWRAPWRDSFVAAMARPGEGTLAAWPALPPMTAKTGTLKHTLALAGMAGADQAAAGAAGSSTPAALPEPIIFAVFLNHDLRDRGTQRQEIVDLLRSWRRLAGGAS